MIYEVWNKFKNNIYSYLFAVCMTYWIMSGFFGLPIIGTLIAIVLLHAFLYLFFDYSYCSGLKGIIIFILFTIIYFLVAAIVIYFYSIVDEKNYFLWCTLTDKRNVDFIPGYWLGTLLIISFYSSSTIYYFSIVRARIGVVFLIGLAAFLTNSSKYGDDVSIPSCMFILSFILLYVHLSQNEQFTKGVINKWNIISCILFSVWVVLIALVIPKPDRIPKIAYIDSIINSSLGSAAENRYYGNKMSSRFFYPLARKDASVVGSLTPPNGYSVLFEIDSNLDVPMYFKVNTYEEFINNVWIKNKSFKDKIYSLEDFEKRNKQLETIVNIIENKGVLSDLIRHKFAEFNNISSFSRVEKYNVKCTVIPKNDYPYYLVIPGFVLGEYTTDSEYNNIDMLFDASGNLGLYSKLSNLPIEDITMINYTLVGNWYNLKGGSLEEYILKNFNKEKFEKFINSIQPYIKDKEDNDVIRSIKIEMNEAYENYTKLPKNVSQRIIDLAKELTQNCESDYEKAHAIENYFLSSGFKYDFIQPSVEKNVDYNDFFIFESKKGICVHFASAMTVLARACGLPSRYSEGYVASPKGSEKGKFIITEKDAHAFPEVYIAGYGWMVFEPTVSMGNSGQRTDDFFSFERSVLRKINTLFYGLFLSISNVSMGEMILYVLIFISFVLLVGISIIKAYYYLQKRKILKTKDGKAVELIFSAVAKMYKILGISIEQYDTPKKYADKISQISSIDYLVLAEIYNKFKYAGIEPTNEEIKYAISVYDISREYIKEKAGKIKSILV